MRTSIPRMVWMNGRRVVAVTMVASLLGLVAGLPANALGRRDESSAKAARRVQLDAASVTQLTPSHNSFEVVRKSNATVFTVVYTATTDFFNSPLADIKMGSVLTIAGYLKGRTLVAQDISTKGASNGSSTSGGSSFGAGGPFTGEKWVGNV